MLFLYVHLPCERNEGLDCLRLPCCSLVQTQGLNEYRCTGVRPWASSSQTIWIIRRAQSCWVCMTHPENDFAITPSWYRLRYLALTHIMFLKEINSKKERERERWCDAINFQAACTTYCFHLERVHREECEFNLDNFLVLQRDTRWISKSRVLWCPQY